SQFWPHIGGIPILGARMVRALRGRGWKVCVLTQQDAGALPGLDHVEDIPVYRIDFRKVLESRDAREMQRLLGETVRIRRTFRPDLVSVLHVGPEIFLELQAQSVTPLPLCCTLHSLYPPRSLQPGTLMHRLLSRADWVTTDSAAIFHAMQEVIP